jgi:hypothetical protein
VNELVTIEHLLLSLSYDPAIEARLRSRGNDVEELRRDLEELLGPAVAADDDENTLASGVRLDDRTEMLLRNASAPTCEAILEAIAGGPSSAARELLAKRGATRSSQTVPAESAPGGAAPYRAPPLVTS